MRISRTLIFFVVFFTVFIPSSGTAEPVHDLIEIEKWEKLSNDYDFTENYKNLKNKKKHSKKSSQQPRQFTFSNISWMKFFIVGIVIVVLMVVLVILIINVFKNTGNRITGTKINNTNKEIENIEDADLERMLHDSLTEGNFKDAVRFRYLMLLRYLNRLKYVIWKKDKTNGNYVSEMSGKEGFEIFRKLTFEFDIVYYGDKVLNEAEYYRVLPLFDQLKEILSSHE